MFMFDNCGETRQIWTSSSVSNKCFVFNSGKNMFLCGAVVWFKLTCFISTPDLGQPYRMPRKDPKKFRWMVHITSTGTGNLNVTKHSINMMGHVLPNGVLARQSPDRVLTPTILNSYPLSIKSNDFFFIRLVHIAYRVIFRGTLRVITSKTTTFHCD